MTSMLSGTADPGSPAGTTGSSPVADATATTPGPARFSTSLSRTAGTTSGTFPPEDEQHAIKVLFELLDEFTAEREAAQGAQFSD